MSDEIDNTYERLTCYRCDTDLDRDEIGEPFPVDGEERMLCDPCNLATRILAYSRADPPYVDIGLYSEVVFYARQLAAETIDDPPEPVINQPSDVEDNDE
jgi:hypothetical protein